MCRRVARDLKQAKRGHFCGTDRGYDLQLEGMPMVISPMRAPG